MDKQYVKEINYFNKLIDEVQYDETRFIINIGLDREYFGMVTSNDEDTNTNKFFKYKTLYETLKDLDYKVKYSFKQCIKYAYSQQVLLNFSMIRKTSEEETLAYYYLENALFRTSSLWDLLAQLYNIYCNINDPIDIIYCKPFFKSKFCNADMTSKENAQKIYNYLTEEDDDNIDGRWKGNYQFTHDIRNKMTHRNSPNVTTISNFDFNMKMPPVYSLKRTIEDYYQVSKFMGEILSLIDTSIFSLRQTIE